MKRIHGNSLTKKERFDKYVKELNKIHSNRFEYIFESFSALTNPIEFIDKTTGKKHKQLLTNHFKSLPRELRDYSKDQMLPLSEIENRLKEIFKESTLAYSVKEGTKLSGKLETKCSVCDTKYNKRISDYRKHPLCGICVKNNHKRLKEEYYKNIINEKYPDWVILNLIWEGYANTKVKIRDGKVEFTRYLETLIKNNSNSSNIRSASLEDRRTSFKEKSLLAHNNKYEYDIPLCLDGSEDTRTTLDFYYNQRSLVPIYCPVHKSIFKQDAGNHSVGHGCDLCANEKNAKSLIRDPYDVIVQAKQLHVDEDGIPLYEYDEVFLNSYKGSTEIASIYCKVHKKYFPQNLSHHLQGSGCPDCANIKRAGYKTSQAELDLKEYLESLGLEVFLTNYLDCMQGLELDLYIPSINLAIEYNGYTYHHSSFDSENEYFKTKARDNEYHLRKYNLAKENGINLIHIWDFEDIDVWKDLLRTYIERPEDYIINFDNTLRLHKNLKCYGISRIDKKVKMSQYTQEVVVETINKMYPDVDTKDVIFTRVRDNIILHHPEYGTIERTPESIFKSSSLNFNGTRIKAADTSLVPKKQVTGKAAKVAREAINEIEQFLLNSELTSEDYIKNYTLPGTDYTISFYIPSKNYGINFNSALTCHSSNTEYIDSKIKKYYKDKNYNFNLWKAYHDKGITVFNIYDFYWVLPEKKPIILSKIQHGIGKDKKVYARKCRIGIDEVSIKASKEFLEENHLEGSGFYYRNSRVFSLHDKDTNETLMVAVVGQYFEQGSGDKFVNKLGRIATKKGITVVGGLSKLTKEIIKEYGNFHYLITLSSGGSSLNHSEGSRLIDPRYFWVNTETLEYEHRNKCQKSVLEKHFGKPLWDVVEESGRIRQCTEREYMESLQPPYIRIFDNGLSEVFFGEEHIGSGVKDE